MNTVATVNTQQTHQWWVLVILATGLSLIVLDATIVGVSMPSIMHELEVSLVDAQRVTALYNTVLAALLLASGRLGDRVGRKHTFVAGLGFFLAGSVLAALSTTAWALIGGRNDHTMGALALDFLGECTTGPAIDDCCAAYCAEYAR